MDLHGCKTGPRVCGCLVACVQTTPCDGGNGFCVDANATLQETCAILRQRVLLLPAVSEVRAAVVSTSLSLETS